MSMMSWWSLKMSFNSLAWLNWCLITGTWNKRVELRIVVWLNALNRTWNPRVELMIVVWLNELNRSLITVIIWNIRIELMIVVWLDMLDCSLIVNLNFWWSVFLLILLNLSRSLSSIWIFWFSDSKLSR